MLRCKTWETAFRPAHLRHRPHPRVPGVWMANELGLDYEHLPIEIGATGARSPEFLAINPNGRLPFIVDNGFVLFESLAITLYLAKKHSNRKLYPGTLEDEASAWQWSLWAVTEVDRGVNIWSLHAVRLPPAERDAVKRNGALKVLVAPFKVLDVAVAKQKYLLGNDFTVADLNVAAVISRAVDMDLSAIPNLKAWLTRCLERPAARKALALKAKADNERWRRRPGASPKSTACKVEVRPRSTSVVAAALNVRFARGRTFAGMIDMSAKCQKQTSPSS